MNRYLRNTLMLIGLCVGGLLSGQVHALTEECPELTDVSPKKIAIFTDGTGNTKSDQTNVRRLYEKLVAQGRGDIVAYYDKGVGNPGTKIIGGALGVGLSRNVRQAYRCLAEQYLPGDQIYLFGFSRGAYTARVLGGVIHQMGVMRFPEGLSKSDQRVLVAELYDIYQHNGDADFDEQRERFQSVHPTQSVTIDVMAVWDTVAALGLTPARDSLHEQCLESGFLSWLGQFFGKDEDACLLERASTRLYQDYHQVGPQGIRKILHAVSIDERRNAFNIELYDEADLTSGQSLKQVWFAGVHSDIGGGYEDSDALSNITLNWMMQNLREDNLLSVDSAAQGRPDGRMHTSYKSFYKKADPVIREIKPGSAIHRSVVQRMIAPLSQPNVDREPDGVYRPVQFEPCLQGQEPTTSRIEACGFNVVDD